MDLSKFYCLKCNQVRGANVHNSCERCKFQFLGEPCIYPDHHHKFVPKPIPMKQKVLSPDELCAKCKSPFDSIAHNAALLECTMKGCNHHEFVYPIHTEQEAPISNDMFTLCDKCQLPLDDIEHSSACSIKGCNHHEFVWPKCIKCGLRLESKIHSPAEKCSPGARCQNPDHHHEFVPPVQVATENKTTPPSLLGFPSIASSNQKQDVSNLEKKAKTQKAKGVLGLPKILEAGGFIDKWGNDLSLKINPSALVQMEEDIEQALLEINESKVFVRPCPKVPRHGFVESRALDANKNNVKRVLEEALLVDPQSELLVCRPINAKWSAVWTPYLISFGSGNDGATSGSPFLSLVLSGKNPFKGIQSAYGIKEEETPYVEIVSDTSNNHHAVQFRSGPSVNSLGEGDFIPKSLKIKRVVEATGDLLEFEKIVIESEKESGVVFYRKGDSLISHYAAHCVMRGIPYITSRIPKIGEFLKKSSNTQGDYDLFLLRKGLLDGMSGVLSKDSSKYLTKMAVVATHHSQIWRSGESVYTLGLMSGILVRMSSVICLHEMKYVKPTSPSHKKWKGIPQSKGRNGTYQGYLNKPKISRQALSGSFNGFLYGNWEGAVGGRKWAECAAHVIDLDELHLKFIKNPSQELAQKIGLKMHSIVNVSHNNGRMLTKFVSGQDLDKIAGGSAPQIIKSISDYVSLLDNKGNWSSFLEDFSLPKKALSPKGRKFWKDGEWVKTTRDADRSEVKVEAQIRLLDPSNNSYRIQIRASKSYKTKEDSIPPSLEECIEENNSPFRTEKNVFVEEYSIHNQEILKRASKFSMYGSDALYMPMKVKQDKKNLELCRISLGDDFNAPEFLFNRELQTLERG